MIQNTSEHVANEGPGFQSMNPPLKLIRRENNVEIKFPRYRIHVATVSLLHIAHPRIFQLSISFFTAALRPLDRFQTRSTPNGRRLWKFQINFNSSFRVRLLFRLFSETGNYCQ